MWWLHNHFPPLRSCSIRFSRVRTIMPTPDLTFLVRKERLIQVIRSANDLNQTFKV